MTHLTRMFLRGGGQLWRPFNGSVQTSACDNAEQSTSMVAALDADVSPGACDTPELPAESTFASGDMAKRLLRIQDRTGVSFLIRQRISVRISSVCASAREAGKHNAGAVRDLHRRSRKHNRPQHVLRCNDDTPVIGRRRDSRPVGGPDQMPLIVEGGGAATGDNAGLRATVILVVDNGTQLPSRLGSSGIEGMCLGVRLLLRHMV